MEIFILIIMFIALCIYIYKSFIKKDDGMRCVKIKQDEQILTVRKKEGKLFIYDEEGNILEKKKIANL